MLFAPKPQTAGKIKICVKFRGPPLPPQKKKKFVLKPPKQDSLKKTHPCRTQNVGPCSVQRMDGKGSIDVVGFLGLQPDVRRSKVPETSLAQKEPLVSTPKSAKRVRACKLHPASPGCDRPWPKSGLRASASSCQSRSPVSYLQAKLSRNLSLMLRTTYMAGLNSFCRFDMLCKAPFMETSRWKLLRLDLQLFQQTFCGPWQRSPGLSLRAAPRFERFHVGRAAHK